MTDMFTQEQRSYNMSRIKSRDTKPELNFRKNFKEFAYQPKVFGKPDFINYKNKTVLFIDGCFWHKCPLHYKEPKSNRIYWLPKIEKNTTRDSEIGIAYKNAGWKVIRIWEHKINSGVHHG